MSILRERHLTGCLCSYCKQLKYAAQWSFGFWAPLEKAFNSWWVIFLVRKWGCWYFRFTLPFLPVVRSRSNDGA